MSHNFTFAFNISNLTTTTCKWRHLGAKYSATPSVFQGFGLVWKALNPEQSINMQSVSKVSLELLGQQKMVIFQFRELSWYQGCDLVHILPTSFDISNFCVFSLHPIVEVMNTVGDMRLQQNKILRKMKEWYNNTVDTFSIMIWNTLVACSPWKLHNNIIAIFCQCYSCPIASTQLCELVVCYYPHWLYPCQQA